MNLKKLRCTNDRVLLRRVKPAEMTASGIVLPETAERETSEVCDVVCVGPGAQLEDGSRRPMAVAVGDRVLVANMHRERPSTFDGDDGEKYVILRESGLLAIV